MKFRDCFIDENGNIWRALSLIKKADLLPIIDFQLSELDIETVIRWRLVNIRDYINHYNRVKNADLSNPIILRSDGYCMNGWHRIIKALSMGVKILPAKKFTQNPEPDFKANQEIEHIG